MDLAFDCNPGFDVVYLDGRTRNFEWYVENYDSLVEQYGDAHIIIVDCAVVGVYDNFGEAVRAASAYDTYNVQTLSRSKRAYKVEIATPYYLR